MRKLSKESFALCRQLQYIENFAIRSAYFNEYLCSVSSKTPYRIILFDVRVLVRFDSPPALERLPKDKCRGAV